MEKLLFLLFLLITLNSLAQKPDKESEKDSLGLSKVILTSPSENIRYIPNYSPLSPNSAVIQKFGDYKVNLATGITDIHIPLYEIVSGDLKMPVVLRYHPSGFKVYDQASWVGYGWALDWGASVNRTVQGLPDEGAGGYIQNPITLSKDFCNDADDFQYGGQVAGGATDAQPDIFSYQIPDKNGHFIFGSSGESFFKIPDYPITIDTTRSPYAITSFKIVDDNGKEYRFAEQENQDVYVSGNFKSYTGSWLITEVRSPNTADSIQYAYQSGGFSQHYQPSWYTQFITEADPVSFGQYTNTTLSIPQQTSLFSSNYHQIPQKITFPNGELEFILGYTREDQAQAYYLDYINLYLFEDGVKKLRKKIKFNYGYFKYGTENAKLKLNSLTFTDENEVESEIYTFDYWTDTIAWPNYPQTTNGIDFFGYYNGASNSHLIPISNYNAIPVAGGAANRETVTTYLKNAMLKKITFPTQGYTEFDYEPNQYKWLGSAKPGGGLRIKSIKSVSGTSFVLKRYEYASDDGSDVGLLATNWDPDDPKIPLIQDLDYTRNPFGPPPPPDNSTAKIRTYTQDGTASSLYTMDAAVIYYTRVSEYFEESSNTHKNGKNIYTFDFYKDNIISAINFAARTVKPWLRGNLLSKATYDKDELLVASDTIQYSEMATQSRLAAAFVSQPWVFDGVSGTSYPCPTTYQPSRQAYNYMPVSYQTGIRLPVSRRSYIQGVSQKEDIFYTDKTAVVDRIETMGSKAGEKFTETYRYPFSSENWSSPASAALRERNMLTVRLETHQSHSIGITSTTYFKGKQTYYTFPGQNARGFSGNILPQEYSDTYDGSTWVSRVVFDNYNAKGRPVSYYLSDKNVPVSLLWGYNDALLMAEMKNISLTEALSALTTVGLDWENMNNHQLTSAQKTKIRNLQGYFPNGHISWYAYQPGIGLTNKIYPDGLLESYEYDSHFRLKAVKDHNGNLVDSYHYQYATTNP